MRTGESVRRGQGMWREDASSERCKVKGFLDNDTLVSWRYEFARRKMFMFRGWGDCFHLALFPGCMRYTIFIVRMDDKIFESSVSFLFAGCFCLTFNEFHELRKVSFTAIDIFPNKFFCVGGRSSITTSSANKNLSPVF